MADLRWGSSDADEALLALKSKLVQWLGEREESPLHGRIVIGEEKKSELACVTLNYMMSSGLRGGESSQQKSGQKPLYDDSFAGGTRTRNLPISSRVLYPLELQLRKQNLLRGAVIIIDGLRYGKNDLLACPAQYTTPYFVSAHPWQVSWSNM